MKNKIHTKVIGGKNVKNFDMVSNLISQPWLVEASWLEAMVHTFVESGADASTAFDKAEEEAIIKDSFYDYASHSYLANESTLVIPVVGPIFPRENMYTRYYTAVACDAVDFTIQKVKNDDKIKAVVFYYDSPGGYVTGVNHTALAIEDLGKTKETVGYVSGTCASAAYWFASSCNSIYAEETSRIGSIGVAVSYPKNDDGYYVEIVNDESPNKRPDVSTEEGVQVVKEELNALAKIFISSVAKGRGVSNKTVTSDFGKGGVLVGADAVEAGMIDGVSTFSEILSIDYDDEENKNKGDHLMDAKTLKADHPDIYQAIVDDAKKEVTDAAASLEEENTSLKGKVTAQEGTITAQEDRLKALEKTDALRTEQDIKNDAHSAFVGVIGASDVPERLYAKVEKQVDYNAHVEDSVFDKVAYVAAVEEELKDWTGSFAVSTEEPFVQGTSSGKTPEQSNEDIDAEKAADDLCSILGIEVKEEN